MPGGDTEVTADRLLEHRNATAVVDTNGIGAGVFDKLRNRGMSAVPLNVGTRTSARDSTGQIEFYNLKSQAVWKLREALDPSKNPTLCLPPGDALAEDLAAPRWKNMAGGKLLVEPKDEVRKRLNRSPDRGDAVVLANWLNADSEYSADESSFAWVDPNDDIVDNETAIPWQMAPDEPEVFELEYNIGTGHRHGQYDFQ
jgi:hypothetical protein